MSVTTRFIKEFVVVGFIALLAACGGGTSSSTAGKSYPIASAMINKISGGMQAPVDITAQALGLALNGTGTFSSSAAASASFAGQAAMSINHFFVGTVNGGTLSAFLKDTIYYDSNYNELGYTRDANVEMYFQRYTIVTDHHPIPATAKINDSGPLDATTSYSDQTKSFIVHTGTSAYTIDADTDASVIFHVTTKFYNTNNVLTETQDERYRIDSAGHISFVSFDIVAADGSIATHFSAH